MKTINLAAFGVSDCDVSPFAEVPFRFFSLFRLFFFDFFSSTGVAAFPLAPGTAFGASADARPLEAASAASSASRALRSALFSISKSRRNNVSQHHHYMRVCHPISLGDEAAIVLALPVSGHQFTPRLQHFAVT